MMIRFSVAARLHVQKRPKVMFVDVDVDVDVCMFVTFHIDLLGIRNAV